MVLQDLGDTPSDNYDNSYPSNDDAWSSSSSSRRYDASQLPQPIPVLGPFLGFRDSIVRFKTEQTIKYAEQKIRRPMTSEETTALAFHLYKMEQTKSYFTAVGVAAGAWRWYNTMSIYRYPFYLPKPEAINPNKFLFIKGPLAQYSRQSWRFFLYGLVAGEMGKLIGQIVAQPLAARDTAADEKLARFAADLKGGIANDQKRTMEAMEKRRAEFLGQKSPQEGTSSQQLPPHAGAPRPWGSPRRQAPQPALVENEDYMSPTAGNDSWPSNSSGSYGDPSFDSEPSQNDTQKQQPPARRQPPSSWDQQPSPSAEDDSSPTGGLFQEEARNQPKAGESAWERIRRGRAPLPGQRPPQQQRTEPAQSEQREGSTLGDSWTFAGSDDERKREQDKAQREFDERIERERQSKDFNDEGRKW